MLVRVDDQLGSISDSLREAVARSDEIRTGSEEEHERALDLHAGLERTSQRFLAAGGSGYGVELEREVAKAGATQRPLVLVLIGEHELAGAREAEQAATEIATLAGRVTRTGDIVVRRGSGEVGVLLPATTMEGGRRFAARLRAALKSSADPAARVSIGVVEWRPNESSTSLDARASSAVDRDGVSPLERSGGALDVPEAR